MCFYSSIRDYLLNFIVFFNFLRLQLHSGHELYFLDLHRSHLPNIILFLIEYIFTLVIYLCSMYADIKLETSCSIFS